jgi:hypothetical protein
MQAVVDDRPELDGRLCRPPSSAPAAGQLAAEMVRHRRAATWISQPRGLSGTVGPLQGRG